MSRTITWYESDSRALGNAIAERLIAEFTVLQPDGDDAPKHQVTATVADAIEQYLGKG